MNLNKEYPKIKSKISYHKNGKPKTSCKVKVECCKCSNLIYLRLFHYLNNQNRLCRHCAATTEKRTNRLRKLSQIQKGKTYEELYGIEKAKQRKDQLREQIANRDITSFIYAGARSPKIQKGKTYEELYGIKKASTLRKNISLRTKGKNNPMYGKPTPKKAGNGISGWYKGWYFRSILELSFMINYIEANKIKWKSAECNKYKIPYIDYKNSERNYFPDFILNDIIIAEIKPENLKNTPLINLKKEAAVEFCKDRNLTYKIYTENDFNKLTNKEVYQLWKNQSIKILNNKHIDIINNNNK